ncbi:hypothetical protein [Salmonella phage GG32]|uniref:Uncharacterized protein n=1 Tax=Salmonella phage GG32 TaxID=1868169 RepID=A0A193GY46_9CAUD|nr:hypothetical protein BI169_gp105 [Salmonella phage GG32]ANN85954.1 hypothetical protein [Salmonella phage GG32]
MKECQESLNPNKRRHQQQGEKQYICQQPVINHFLHLY